MQTHLSAAWPRLERWLELHLDEVRRDLAPGAGDESIAALEQLIGQPLPASLKAFYRGHDGQAGAAPAGLFYGLPFLSLEGVARHWQEWRELREETTPEDQAALDSFCSSTPPEAVKVADSDPGWIPIAHDHAGNYLGIDLAPGPAGTLGQVINFGRDERHKFVLAASLDAFLEYLVAELESGNFVVQVEEDGGRSFNMKTPRSGHFLDAARKLFGG